MAHIETEAWEATGRQRFLDQLELMRRGNDLGVTAHIPPRDDPEHMPTFTVPNFLVVEDEDGPSQADKLKELRSFLTRSKGSFVTGGKPFGTRVVQVTEALSLVELPRQKGKRPEEDGVSVVLEALQGVARPEYYFHASADHGRPCPATEPEETGLTGPWPGINTSTPDAGQGVKVTVVDTGWWPGASAHSWLADDVDGDEEPIGRNLHAYSGHGTFIAGVVRCRAPKAQIHHERFRVQPRRKGQRYADYQATIRESEIIQQLVEALDRHDGDDRPHIINLSAGSYTLDNQELSSLTAVGKRISQLENTVLIAAAGNDASNVPFYPAASPWATGVGSLDSQGGVSNFSNFGQNADLYVLGRNHVNAFPDGRYRCRETPDKADIRIFRTGLARWSGTSFSAPVVAGLLAADLSANPGSKAESALAKLLTIPEKQVKHYGKIKKLRPKFPPALEK